MTPSMKVLQMSPNKVFGTTSLADLNLFLALTANHGSLLSKMDTQGLHLLCGRTATVSGSKERFHSFDKWIRAVRHLVFAHPRASPYIPPPSVESGYRAVAYYAWRHLLTGNGCNCGSFHFLLLSIIKTYFGSSQIVLMRCTISCASIFENNRCHASCLWDGTIEIFSCSVFPPLERGHRWCLLLRTVSLISSPFQRTLVGD